MSSRSVVGFKNARPRPIPWVSVGRGLLYSNFRLIATMRSRSKKGEAGLCCAQPCNRPKPIAIMVLPTEYQPESLIRFRVKPFGRQRVLYRPRAATPEMNRSVGSETYTIILLCERLMAIVFARQIATTMKVQSLCRNAQNLWTQTPCHQ
jgi:hypothetical protein